jgi:hypothetical protein
MTIGEARKVAAIASTADGGCHVCVGGLCDRLAEAFPQFLWTYPVKVPRQPEDEWDEVDDDEFVDVIQVSEPTS